MQTSFYVSHAGEQQGPFEKSIVVQMIQDKKLDLNDYCYDETKEDWVFLIDHPQFSMLKDQQSPQLKAKEPSPWPKSVETKTSSIIEWYVLKGQSKFGPFTHIDVVKMLQEKSIFEFDYVWHADLAGWQRIAELAEFSAEKIRSLKTSAQNNDSEVFFRRRHVRVDFESSIIIHDNKHVWKGQSLEVSSGGAGIVIENPLLQPGQTLYLHFKPADGIPPFNAVCEIVSKQFVKVLKDKEAPVRYGVKFTSIQPNAQKHLADLGLKSPAGKQDLSKKNSDKKERTVA